MPLILIIDDEDLMRESLAVFLRSRGYEVMTAPNPAAALEAMKTPVPQLVLLDVGLGEADGLELLATFKRDWPHVPVVVLTGNGWDDGLRQESFHKGADGFLVKGMPIDEFMSALADCLRGKGRCASGDT